MKIKHGFFASGLLGIAALAIRLAQYVKTIGSDGYYNDHALSHHLHLILTAVLAAGALLSILCGMLQKNKKNITFSSVFGHFLPISVLFSLLGGAAAADGIFRLIGKPTGSSVLVGLLCLAGALGWFFLARGEGCPAPAKLLPLLHLCAVVLAYFLKTYKYVQISEYMLDMLALCAILYFTMLLLKLHAGADCSIRRLISSACLALLFCLAALPASSAAASDILLSIQFFLYILLSAITLLLLPHAPKADPALANTVDPETLNQYISDILETEEEPKS